MTFPELTPIDRRGELRCGSQLATSAPACGAPATWHVAWWLAPQADFSLLCDKHMAQTQQELTYVDRHPADANCDMPGTGWLKVNPSRCVPVSTTEAEAGRISEPVQTAP
jgi:hypothetical protein